MSAGELSTLFAFQAHSAMIVSSHYLGDGNLITAGLDCKVCSWQISNLPAKKKKKGKSKEDGIEVTQKWGIDHGCKINTAVAPCTSDSAVYVCDTTNEISAYTIRC
ncbi:hypothetical protein EON65_14015 [archaeon]|nr:MAG: hypothetical protein EON65_14015 [archaeon]